eukprot:TRINITY_DN5247_c0_g1_i1.p1 TRINITY_DN5247_c0_g1~~TRINITY_DN5247_c0_g1_i1.p1  ORF type:complete len:123 (-),score=22.45 TRINITY_DN5247_c0_g1_i1:98-466(-)
MEFVYEDMDQMSNELLKWKEEYEKHATKLQEVQRDTQEFLKPLMDRLERVDQSIEEQKSRIQAEKALILRNEEKISNLLDKCATIPFVRESGEREEDRETDILTIVVRRVRNLKVRLKKEKK